jgi:DNA-formamidopyrimidine glycosylase
MPEGPEAYNISKCINKRFKGCSIEKVSITDKGKLYNFDNISLPQEIKNIYSIGKKIIIKVHNGYYVSSLGMEGSFVYCPDKYCNVTFRINDDNMIFTLYFRDIRRFGSIIYFDNKKKYKNYIGKLGPDMLNNPPTIGEFRYLVERYPRKVITSFLLEQEILSGIGNYLKSEILYKAKINPNRNMSDLKSKEIKRLYNSIIQLIAESAENNGLTIKSYKTPDNRKGLFTTKVYQKSIDPYNNKIIRCTDKNRRVTYWAPEVQI